MNANKIFDNIIVYYYKNIKSLKNITFKYIFFLLIISVTIVPSLAISPHENQSGIPENKTCSDCHVNSHQGLVGKLQQSGSTAMSQQQGVAQKALISGTSDIATTNVVGNINLISSVGQDWYQQGVYGPDGGYGGGGVHYPLDKSWGWTFFDENPPSGFITPPENVTQANNIYALLLDDGNDSNPIIGAIVVANVTYWTYDNISYVSHVMPVQLTEDTNRKGFYSGRFDFYGGTTYAGYDMRNCGGCHSSMYGTLDTQIGYFPGNYSVSIRADADGKTKITGTSFDVTAWGCEDCHGSGNVHRASAEMDSACYICHGINDISGMSDAGNPHQIAAHRSVPCTACHTNKSLNSQTFNGVTFTSGGLNGQVPVYNYNVVQLNNGVHSTMVCTDCHNSLMLPSPSGGHGSYTVSGVVNNYNPSFTSIKQFQDYYVINVDSANSLNITLNWDGTANLGFYLYPPDFNPKNDIIPPYYNGATPMNGISPTNKPEIYNGSNLTIGQWVLQVVGYDERYDFIGWNSWGGVLQPPINYTVTSTYPIQGKDLPSTPECNTCHNSGSTGGAYTKDIIPNWNPGFAHTDTNGDGTLDIQCRMCHDSMHNIGIKTCQNCHTTAPTNHPIRDPAFSQYTPDQCLACHGDPHRVTLKGGTDCIGCHVPGDVNTSKFARHANLNTSDGGPNNVTNSDCWTCHYQKDMDRSKIYLCESCHNNVSGIVPVNDPLLIKSDFMHDSTACRTCHAPIDRGYHLNGTVGPLGTVERILGKIQNP